MTPERVREWFGDMIQGEVVRYQLPQLAAMNFVIYGALGGGVTRSLSLDPPRKELKLSLIRYRNPAIEKRCL